MSVEELAAVDAGGYAVISVDLFDTLLLRDASVQRARFHEVAALVDRQLRARGHDIDTRVLLRLRQQVHHLAYAAVDMERPGGDTTLARMIAVQLTLLGLDLALAPVLLAAELEVEARHLAANRKLLRWLSAMRATGKRVIGLSDMYFAAADLEQLVCRVLGASPLERIYVSSELGRTKRSGEAFAIVAARENVPPGRMLHCGDDRIADLAMARAAGCQAVLLPPARPMRLARKLAAVLSLKQTIRIARLSPT